MDTRSVVRSRRRSTRLTGHSPHSSQDERAKPPTKTKKRDSSHGTSGPSSSSASRESSYPVADRDSKNASLSLGSHPKAQDDKTAKPSPKEATKDKDDGPVHPLFPNLPLFQANIAAFARDETEPITAPRKKSTDAPSKKAKKDHVSNKWVKTARGSIRLASDAPAEASKNATDKELGETHEAHNAPSAAARRRSRRLASISPDVTDEMLEVVHSRRQTAVNAEVPPPVTADSDEPEEWEEELELDLPHCSAKSTTEKGLSTQPTHHDKLPAYDLKTGYSRDPKSDQLKNITPIPELVADIERIVLSSPLAAKHKANDGNDGISSPTPAAAVKKQAPAGMMTRSRALRSSSRSIDGVARIGKSLDLEPVDSDSSQIDGAYDDSIRGQKRKKAQVNRGKANITKPSEPRGTKRRAQELSESEANAPSQDTQQRRDPVGDHSTPEVDLSSSNPIDSATSRDAFAVDDPNAEMAVGISEFARRNGEPLNPVMLAQMISSNNRPEQAESDDDNGSTLAHDGSQHSPSPDRTISDIDSTRGHQGSAESSRPQTPEADRPTCGDCGRAPLERYIVCARCLVVVYCGKYCQLWNWPVHKTGCNAADEAVQEEVDEQEKYLGDMWAAAVRMLEEEENAGGTVESLLLDEAVRHSGTRPLSMGRGRPRGFDGIVAGASRFVPRDSELMDGTRAMAIQLAQAAQGGDD